MQGNYVHPTTLVFQYCQLVMIFFISGWSMLCHNGTTRTMEARWTSYGMCFRTCKTSDSCRQERLVKLSFVLLSRNIKVLTQITSNTQLIHDNAHCLETIHKTTPFILWNQLILTEMILWNIDRNTISRGFGKAFYCNHDQSFLFLAHICNVLFKQKKDEFERCFIRYLIFLNCVLIFFENGMQLLLST